MPVSILPSKDEISQHIRLKISKHGRHVGFLSGSLLHPEYWMEKRIIEFFTEFL